MGHNKKNEQSNTSDIFWMAPTKKQAVDKKN